MQFAISPPSQPSIEIFESEQRFPVRRIFCVGRNYAEHAREMGADADREPPFFFTKPGDAVGDSGTCIAYPPLTQDLHHEIEMVIAIGTGGANISQDMALDHIFGYGVGIDLTRRDLQAEAKKMRRPWDWGKAFDQSAPCGPIKPAAQSSHPSEATISLSVNGKERQRGDIGDMIWSVPEIIAIISKGVCLAPGDLVYSGTPAGVAAVTIGDQLHGEVSGVGEIDISIA